MVKSALDLAGRGLDGLVLDFVRTYEVCGVDGNIGQEHAAIDSFIVVSGVPMADPFDAVSEHLALLVDRRDIIHVAQLEESLGAAIQDKRGKQGGIYDRGQKAKNEASATGDIEAREKFDAHEVPAALPGHPIPHKGHFVELLVFEEVEEVTHSNEVEMVELGDLVDDGQLAVVTEKLHIHCSGVIVVEHRLIDIIALELQGSSNAKSVKVTAEAGDER